jgi:drug/metabolite transporter (DMT)-like permease
MARSRFRLNSRTIAAAVLAFVGVVLVAVAAVQLVATQSPSLMALGWILVMVWGVGMTFASNVLRAWKPAAYGLAGMAGVTLIVGVVLLALHPSGVESAVPNLAPGTTLLISAVLFGVASAMSFLETRRSLPTGS